MLHRHLLKNRASCASAAMIAMFVISGAAHGGGVLYVDDDAPPGGDGTSWNTAYRFLQDAMTDAGGGGIAEIHVGQGIYTPDRDEANPDGTGDRQATLQLVNGVALMGGYAGIVAKDPDDRDIDLYETVLSGDLLGDDEPDFQNNKENSYHVITGFRLAKGTEISGCTVISGNADGTAPHNHGAGITVDGGSVLVDHCRVISNWAVRDGAGLYSNGADLTLVSCEFQDNQVQLQAAAVYCNNSTVTVSSCTFARNAAQATSCGGIYLEASSAEFFDCEFLENAADSSPLDRGGAVFVTEASAASFTRCWFNGNTAGGGGAVFSRGDIELFQCALQANRAINSGGGAILSRDSGSLVLSDCTFDLNYSDRDGGAVGCSGIVAEIENCVFVSNTSIQDGGGIYNAGTVLNISSCTFEDNFSGDSGGGLSNTGGALAAITTLQDCSFVGNFAGRGGAIACNNATVLVMDSCQVIDNFTSLSGAGIYWTSALPGSLMVATNCRVTGNAAPSSEGGGILASGIPILLDRCMIAENLSDNGSGLRLFGCEGLVIDCDITSNQLEGGGNDGGAGANLENCDNLAFIGCTFRENLASGSVDDGGGGVYMENSDVAFVNCVFSDNSFGSFAPTARGGGALFALDSSPLLANCTIYRNSTTLEGGGIYLLDSSAMIDNSILWNNVDKQGQGETSQIFVEGNSSIEFNYSTLEGLTGNLGGIGNIGDDPLFVDPDGPDDLPGNEDDDLRLSPDSPCIDAADNTAVPKGIDTDLDGNPRFVDDPDTTDTGFGDPPIVDMGAYEFQVVSPCPWDLDGSSDVGVKDLLFLLGVWGPCPKKGDCPADFDDSGDVGVKDLLVLLGNWGPCP